MHSLTLLYDFGETKVQQRNFIAKGNKRKHRFLQVRHVFIEKVRCFYFPERELHNLNAVFKPFRGHIHHVQLYIKNMVFLLFRETWMPLMVHQLLELSNRCCPFTIDAVPVAII